MINPIKQIVDFNEKAGLLNNGYDDLLESSLIIEEALEGFPYLSDLDSVIKGTLVESSSAKDVSRTIISYVTADPHVPLSDVDRLDKAVDQLIFAVGAMAKLNLNANQITRAINAVMHANLQKLGMPRDSHGKLIKPEGFVGPEAKLQEILDERM